MEPWGNRAKHLQSPFCFKQVVMLLWGCGKNFVKNV